MAIPNYCPACSNILELVKHINLAGEVYYQMECPEGDWFESADPPAEDAQAAREVLDEAS